MPTGQPIAVFKYIFDFDGTLHNKCVQLYFAAVLDNEEDVAFLQNAHDTGYQVSPESVTAYYDDIMERLVKINFNSRGQVMALKEADHGFTKETKRKFADIINKLDPSLFARIILLANQELLNKLVRKVKKHGVQYLDLTVGSNRGCYYLDKLGMNKNFSMSVYVFMAYLQQFFKMYLPNVDVQVNPFCAADICNRLKRGTSFKKITAQHLGEAHYPELEKESSVYDNQKLWLLYLISHDAIVHYKKLFPQLADHDNVQIHSFFFDDLREIAFAQYPAQLFPVNFSLSAILYNGEYMQSNPTVLVGSGEVDPYFHENAFVMMECADYNSRGVTECEYDFLKRLDVKKFIANRITANRLHKIAVVDIDDYLENSVYENVVMHILDDHSALLEFCIKELKEKGDLSAENKKNLTCIVPGEEAVMAPSHFNLSRFAQAEYGFHSLKSANDKWEALSFCKSFFAELLNMPSFDEDFHYHHFLSLIASKVEWEVFREALLANESMDANTREEILRDASVSKFDYILSEMGEKADMLKSKAIFTGYLPLCVLLKGKVEAAKCQHILFATEMSPGDALYQHIIHLSAFLMNYLSLGCHVGEFNRDGYVQLPIQLIAKKEVIYQAKPNCALWQSAPLPIEPVGIADVPDDDVSCDLNQPALLR